MDLLLWRHAEAEDGAPDAQRRLTRKGEKQAARMADWIRRHAPKNLRIVASPAVRCQQTAQALDRPFDTDERLAVDRSVSDLLAAAGWPDGKEKAVLVVGHQPTLGRAAARLLSGSEIEQPLKKGGVWWISCAHHLLKTRVRLDPDGSARLAELPQKVRPHAPDSGKKEPRRSGVR